VRACDGHQLACCRVFFRKQNSFKIDIFFSKTRDTFGTKLKISARVSCACDVIWSDQFVVPCSSPSSCGCCHCKPLSPAAAAAGSNERACSCAAVVWCLIICNNNHQTFASLNPLFSVWWSHTHSLTLLIVCCLSFSNQAGSSSSVVVQQHFHYLHTHFLVCFRRRLAPSALHPPFIFLLAFYEGKSVK